MSKPKIIEEIDNLKSGQENLTSQMAQKPSQTTENITYYVSPTGSDTNDGLTSGTAFKTIQYAIDKLPQIINHTVNINVAQGTYNEDVEIDGFVGEGGLNIIGGSSVSELYNVLGIVVKSSSLDMNIKGFNSIKAVGNSFSISNITRCNLSYCKASIADNVYACVACYYAIATISDCQFDNKGIAIRSSNCSTVYSSNNIGTGNTYGLQASSGGTICKNGTQPSGTTAEATSGGGVIR